MGIIITTTGPNLKMLITLLVLVNTTRTPRLITLRYAAEMATATVVINRTNPPIIAKTTKIVRIEEIITNRIVMTNLMRNGIALSATITTTTARLSTLT
jgi:hypothetical protein